MIEALFSLKATEWIGIYGAVVATGTFLYSIATSRTRLKVRLQTHLDHTFYGSALPGVKVTIQNASPHEVVIQSADVAFYPATAFAVAELLARIRRPSKLVHARYYGKESLPVTVPARASFEFQLTDKVLEEDGGGKASAIIRVRIADAVGTRKISRPFHWTKSPPSDAPGRYLI